MLRGSVVIAALIVFPAAIPHACHAATRDLYSEINAKGSVEVTITKPDGSSGCASFWWIKRLTGGVTPLGRRCGYVRFEIPSLLGISLAAKLRASADAGVAFRVHASDGVAKTITIG